MISLVIEPVIKDIAGIETHISDIKSYNNAEDVICYCLNNDKMPIEIIFSSIDSDYEKHEYESLLHWIYGFCMNLKIKIPTIKINKNILEQK